MNATTAWLAALVASALAAAGCASLLGIEEQSLEGSDAGRDGGASDGPLDQGTGADVDGPAGDTGGPVCSSGAKSCDGQQPRTCVAGAWQNVGAACSGTTLCVDGTCAAPPPSCAQGGTGTTACGASGESCCTSPPVTGGTYDRTYTNSGVGPTGASDPAIVSDFRLDKYEVTVGRFRAFVAAWNGGSGYAPPAGSGKHTHLNAGRGLVDPSSGAYEPGWVASDDTSVAPTSATLASCAIAGTPYATWTPAPGANEALPINCVNWYEAYAFCIWDGGFLPSEAEWEYAAAGGNQLREYPWGSTAPGTSNQYAIYGCNYPDGSGTCTGVMNFAPVGTAAQGAGAFGQVDLAGNVFEWSLDAYAGYVDPCTDCAYLAAPSFRVKRGGALGYGAPSLVASVRANSTPVSRDSDIGFRCARAP